MKIFKCPSCKKERYIDPVNRPVMYVCSVCNVEMEVVDDGNKTD